MPTKLPFDYDASEPHTASNLKQKYPNVGMILDLSNHCLSTYRDAVPGMVHCKLLLTVRKAAMLIQIALEPARLCPLLEVPKVKG